MPQHPGNVFYKILMLTMANIVSSECKSVLPCSKPNVCAGSTAACCCHADCSARPLSIVDIDLHLAESQVKLLHGDVQARRLSTLNGNWASRNIRALTIDNWASRYNQAAANVLFGHWEFLCVAKPYSGPVCPQAGILLTAACGKCVAEMRCGLPAGTAPDDHGRHPVI